MNYAKALWEAFLDITLELISVIEMGSGQVARQLLLRGTLGALKTSIHRLRGRYRALLREEVARTVVKSAEVD